MPEPRPLSEAEEAQLAAFADGQLSDEERAELERRLAADADLARAYERQRAGIVTIASAVESVSAPLALRSRIEAMQRGEAPARRRRLRLPSWLPVAAIATATAVVIAALVFIGGAPTPKDVVAAALRPPTAAVSLDPRQPALLRDRVEAVRFPNFLAKFGWEATGVRTDEIGGRTVRTVFYRKEGRRIAYSIISGPALDWPGDATKRPTGGVDIRTFQSGDRTVVTWRRQGRTCVLSGVNVPLDELLTLAAWNGKGAVRF